jgi:phosphotransferase family enzyme
MLPVDLRSDLRRRLGAQLRSVHDSLGIAEVDPALAGEGLEFIVFRARSSRFGSVAIKVPRRRWTSDANDGDVDMRDLLRQEGLLLAYVGQHGLPVPAVHFLHCGTNPDELDFLIMDFIENDGTEVDLSALGVLLRNVHALAPPPIRLLMHRDSSLERALAERLLRRIRAVSRLAQLELGVPRLDELEHALTWSTTQRSLLHMDARPANVLTRLGQPHGLIDWSNAMIGHPSLELARLAEYGVLDREFQRGYGNVSVFDEPPPIVRTLYRLDTAVMLAIVFLSSAPDQDRAEFYVKRVVHLLGALPALAG